MTIPANPPWNMSHFTPAPWLLTNDGLSVYALNESGTKRMFLNVQGGHETGIREERGIRRTSGKELAANACLIATALDMLAALTALVYEVTHLSAMEDNGDHKCRISAAALANARAAILRATGATDA